MRKLFAILLAVFCVLGVVGCTNQSQQVKGNRLLSEGNVIKIDVSSLPEEYKQEFAKFAIESAMIEAKKYPAHMQDLIVATEVGGFMASFTSIMTLDVLYSTKVFKPLTEEEKTTATLMMFCDLLP